MTSDSPTDAELARIYQRAFAGCSADGYYGDEFCHRYARRRVEEARAEQAPLKPSSDPMPESPLSEHPAWGQQ